MKIGEPVTWTMKPREEFFVAGIELNAPESLLIAKRGKSGKLLKSETRLVPLAALRFSDDDEDTLSENGHKNKWRNRIVAHGVKPADQFQAHPHNWRKHPQFQRDVVTGSLNELGFINVVIENLRTGNLLDGHERVWQALQNNEDVPFIQVDLSEAEETKALLLLDSSSALAMVDSDNLAALLADVSTGDDALQTLLDGLASDGLQDLLNSISDTVSAPVFDEPPEDQGAQLDRAAELQEVWQVAPGDIWEISSESGVGAHRLVCGDSTDSNVVGALMDGAVAEMVWTDPPYGVAIGDKNKWLNSVAKHDRVEDNLDNDTLDETELANMLCATFDNAIAHCENGGAWYVAAPPGPLHVIFGAILKERGIWRQTILWVKNSSTFSPMGVDYHWRAEPIFYGWLPGGGHRFYGGRKQNTVWEIDRPFASPEHPTMKPVVLVARAIENSSRRGELVLDPFGGSGTTMAAAEQLGRVCCMVELAEKYCSVILQRMTDLGLFPQRISNGA